MIQNLYRNPNNNSSNPYGPSKFTFIIKEILNVECAYLSCIRYLHTYMYMCIYARTYILW